MTGKVYLAGLIVIFIILLNFNLISALVIDSVIMNSKGISPGEFTEIEIGLRNNDDETIEDISITLELKELPLAPFDSSSEFGIDEIKEDKIKYAKFKVIALSNSKPETYKIPVKITYKKNEENKIKDSLISIKIISEPVIEVIAEENLLLKGKNNIVEIRIINKGLSDVKFLEIKAGDSNKYEILSNKNFYIGELDSDDFDEIEFNVFFNQDVSDRVNFPIALKYQDVFNNKYEKSFNIPLRIYNKNKAVELGLLKRSYIPYIVTGIIILILLWLIYKWKRRRKKI